MNLRSNISGSSSEENIQTRAFTNSTNRFQIKFHMLLHDNDDDVTDGLPSYIRIK